MFSSLHRTSWLGSSYLLWKLNRFRGFVRKKLLDGKACSLANFFQTNHLNFSNLQTAIKSHTISHTEEGLSPNVFCLFQEFFNIFLMFHNLKNWSLVFRWKLTGNSLDRQWMFLQNSRGIMRNIQQQNKLISIHLK